MPITINPGGWDSERSAWWTLLLLLAAVLLPAGCVLWFMNEAARSQTETVRLLKDAYRGRLLPVRDQVNGFWQARAAQIPKAPEAWTATDFHRILEAIGAASVVLLDSHGAVSYPSPVPPVPNDPTVRRSEWVRAADMEQRRETLAQAVQAYHALAESLGPRLAALAAQAEIRCLVRSGNQDAAISRIQSCFHAVVGPSPALDLQGRLIAADEYWLMLQLVSRSDPRYAAAAKDLAGWLNDYRIAMLSSQRLFLMGELRTAAPELASFPTFDAERLAEQFAESQPVRVASSALERTGVAQVWRLTSPDLRSIMLYREDAVMAAMRELLDEPNRQNTVRFALLPPGLATKDEAIAAGPLLPGWKISIALVNPQAIEEGARRRRLAFLGVGYLAVAAIALVGLLTAGSLRRQSRLARMKTDLAATVSHELKTPLASMRLLLETLLEDGFANEKAAREYVEMISRENQRLSRLIDNFLTFSRMERNRQKLEFAETTAEEVIAPAMAAMKERLRASRGTVDVAVSPGLPPVWADRDALVTVVLNLLDNACKYTPAEKEISVRASREGAHLVLAVKDNGIGIAPREQKRIFRKFYQVDRRLARETGGCGLGLSIVDFVVRAHGGSVQVESTLGVGSTFRVLLPYDAEGKEAHA